MRRPEGDEGGSRVAAELSAGRDNSITRTRSWGGGASRRGVESGRSAPPGRRDSEGKQSWGLRACALPSFSVEGPISGRSWRAAAHECGSAYDHVSRGRRTRTQIQRQTRARSRTARRGAQSLCRRSTPARTVGRRRVSGARMLEERDLGRAGSRWITDAAGEVASSRAGYGSSEAQIPGGGRGAG